MSREEAIEILSDMRAEYNLFGDAEEATRYHVLTWAIYEMKAAQQWIPCNTKEPDEIGCYLLYRPHFWRGNNGQITVCHWNGHRWSDNYTDDESRALSEVRGMAWMPLPEPWKGEEDE